MSEETAPPEMLADINHLFEKIKTPDNEQTQMLAQYQGREKDLLCMLQTMVKLLPRSDEDSSDQQPIDEETILECQNAARDAYLLELANKCIELGVHEEGIEILLDACVDINEDWNVSVADIVSTIDNLLENLPNAEEEHVLNEDEEEQALTEEESTDNARINAGLYFKLALIFGGVIKFGEKAIDEAAELATGHPELFEECNTIVKMCQAVVENLEGAEGKLLQLTNSNNIQLLGGIEAIREHVSNTLPKHDEIWKGQAGINHIVEEEEDDDNDSLSSDHDYESTKKKTHAKKKSTKATKTVKKRAPRRGNDSKTAKSQQIVPLDFEAESKLYNSLSSCLDKSDHGVIAADTNITQVVLSRMNALFNADSIEINDIKKAVNCFITILKPLSKTKACRTIELSSRASRNKAEAITITNGSTWGSVGISCDKSSQEGISTTETEALIFMSQVRDAIKEVLPNTKVDEFIGDFKLRGETANVLANCINIGIGFVTYSLATMNDILGGLSSSASVSSEVLLQRAADLAGLTVEEVGVMIVLVFVNKHLRPALANDDTEEAALVVAFDLKCYTTKTAGKRKDPILNNIRTAQGTKPNEVDGEEANTDFCCGDTDNHRLRRRRIVSITWLLLLLDNIIKRAPKDFLSEEEFLYNLLCCAQTSIHAECDLDVKDFKDSRLSVEVYDKMKKCIKGSYTAASGKRPVIITGNETIECMKELLTDTV